MATLAELRERSGSLYTGLLEPQTRRPPSRRALGLAGARPGAESFSWFNRDDALAAVAMSFRLAAFAGSRARVNDGLALALDHVEAEARVAHPEEVRQAFALFVTHNRDGRRLGKPRTVTAAPALFRPPPARRGRLAISSGGESPGLDYWREDALANEHHQHWHEVYPYAGLPPNDFLAWATDTPRPAMVAILEAIAPGQDWQSQVSGASVSQLASFFAQVVQAQGIGGLAPDLYRVLFRLNDRQGELFFYMHEQMLARYDAELVSNELARVEPFSSALWPEPIPEGQNPIGLQGFDARDENQTLSPDAVQALRAMLLELTTAVSAQSLRGDSGNAVAIDSVNLGEAVEATVPQLRDLDQSAYGGLHNQGHGFIAQLANPPRPGVMTSTATAIRDPVFWRWHKFIDDINFGWQETQAAYDFADAPAVTIRNGAEGDGGAGGDATAWASPDILLCRTSDLPAGQDPTALGAALFGGDQWDTAFPAGPVGDSGLQLVDELTTTMATVPFDGQPVNYLTHEPFSYFVRLENPTAAAASITVRIFLAPVSEATERRAWIEMDKFLLDVPATTKLVVYRPDTESSVVKRPVDLDPARALAGGVDPDEGSYCDCGWPYPLLLPRGTPAGLPFRLLVMATDATVDLVPEADHCGSMSFCGAVDHYPDTRDMGYPFARPFTGPTPTALTDAILAIPHAAGRTLTIRHTP